MADTREVRAAAPTRSTYHHRQSRNPVFRNFWIAVNYLDRRCRRLIRTA